MTQPLIERLRARALAERIGPLQTAKDQGLADQWSRADVRFSASASYMEDQFNRAVKELFSCVKPSLEPEPILQEGGVYMGCWLESTGTINAELLSRFLPDTARNTFRAFAHHQRDDGCFPYKLTADGPVFSQIQLVTPLARSVWTDHQINGADPGHLRMMYDAMARYDAWISKYRDTLGTGAVEAFCTFDTGHDLSSRFWHIPDSPFGNDPTRYNPDNPLLPFIAPDLTANIICQRHYLAQMAEQLGEDPAPWLKRKQQGLDALYEHCFDTEDGFFYDRDRHGRLVKIQSDVLLRVLACEIGDDAFFAQSLSRYLLSTKKFFAKFPFTSIAMDDPRFDPASDYNSWGGPSNFLSLIRAPHAFEHHNRHVELSWVLNSTLGALFRMERFSQTVNAYTGSAGFTEVYSPTILCLLDYVERLCGIQPRPDGTLWFSGLVPQQMDHRDAAHETAYGRTVDNRRFEWISTPEGCTAYRDGEPLFRAPYGARVITDRSGAITGLVALRTSRCSGQFWTPDAEIAIDLSPNEEWALRDGAWLPLGPADVVWPTY